jgi:hypothetical protein
VLFLDEAAARGRCGLFYLLIPLPDVGQVFNLLADF